jgi:hypothetical protein
VWRHRGTTAIALPLFALGLAAGGSVSSIALWGISGLFTPIADLWKISALFLVGVVVVGQEVGFLRLKLPANKRQVPQEVFTNGPYRAAVRFGFELGTGVRTYLPSSVPYLLATAVILLQPHFLHALVAGLSFGLGRASMALLRTASPDPDGWDTVLRHRLRLIQHAAALTAVLACVAIVVGLPR